MGGDANQVDDERNRRASIFLPVNPLKMAKFNTFPVRCVAMIDEESSRAFTRELTRNGT